MGTAANGNENADSFSGGLYATWTEHFALGKAFVTPYPGIEFMTTELKGFSESGPYGRSFDHARAQNWTCLLYTSMCAFPPPASPASAQITRGPTPRTDTRSTSAARCV